MKQFIICGALIALTTFAYVSGEGQDPECPRICQLDYQPVCGVYNGLSNIFGNECEFKSFNCKNGFNWRETRLADCSNDASAESDLSESDESDESLSSQEQKRLQSCEKPCRRNLDPVCAFDGTVHKVFDNQCLLENQHCTDNHSWRAVRMVDCLVRKDIQLDDETRKNCPGFCTDDWNPVCGSDGRSNRQFSNLCEMNHQYCQDNREWRQLRLADCNQSGNEVESPSDPEDCSFPCTFEYVPVCGFNGEQHEIFANECNLRQKKCQTRQDWRETRMDVCETI